MTVMTRRRSLALAIVAVLVGATALAWVVTREQIASGSGKNGDWRVALLPGTSAVADFPGVQAMKGIQALDDQGHVVEELEHGPLPPPGP